MSKTNVVVQPWDNIISNVLSKEKQNKQTVTIDEERCSDCHNTGDYFACKILSKYVWVLTQEIAYPMAYDCVKRCLKEPS